MKNKYLLICHISITVLALFFLLTLPCINIHIYNVYIYNLSRTEISHIYLNFFEATFKNNYLDNSILLLIIPLLIFAILVLDILYYKKGNKTLFYISFGLSVLLLSIQSFSNTIFATGSGIKAYCFIRTFIERYPNFPVLFPQDHINQESIWVDLGIGQFLSIAFIGVKITIYFLTLFLGKNFLNCSKYFGSNKNTKTI